MEKKLPAGNMRLEVMRHWKLVHTRESGGGLTIPEAFSNVETPGFD
jgi:hypothetical protein